MFTAITILETLKTNGITVTATADRLVVTPASRLTDSHRATLKAHKADILKALVKMPDIRHEDASEAYMPLTADFPRTCSGCESFRLQPGHQHAGRCLAGWYPRETLWSTDVRWCGQIAAVSSTGEGRL